MAEEQAERRKMHLKGGIKSGKRGTIKNTDCSRQTKIQLQLPACISLYSFGATNLSVALSMKCRPIMVRNEVYGIFVACRRSMLI